MQDDPNKAPQMPPEYEPPVSPVNAIHPLVLLLFAAVALPELYFMAAENGLISGRGAAFARRDAIADFAFSPRVISLLAQSGYSDTDLLKRVFSYAFVHWSFTHAAFVCVFLLALGKFVSEALGGLATVLVFFFSAVGGALVFGLILEGATPLVGGYPGAYGLIGAYSLILFSRLSEMGQNQLQAFRLIGILLAIQLVFGAFLGAGQDWIADISGAIIGFLVAVVVSPGSLSKFIAQIRRD